MKISEFIERFNELDTVLDIHAAKENAMSHSVEINEFESTAYKTVARLPEDSKDWTFFGCFNFSPEMLELMAEMSELVMESKQNGTTTIVLKDGNKIEVKENAAVVNARYNQADYLDTEELMSWMGSGGAWPFPDPHNRFKVTEKATGKGISLSAKQIQRIIAEKEEGNDKVD